MSVPALTRRDRPRTELLLGLRNEGLVSREAPKEVSEAKPGSRPSMILVAFVHNMTMPVCIILTTFVYRSLSQGIFLKALCPAQL